MTIHAFNSVDVDATACLVGRQACINNIVATITRVEGDKAYTDRAGVVEVGAVGGRLLPRVGDVVRIHGRAVVWLETDLSARTPKGLVLEGDNVIAHSLRAGFATYAVQRGATAQQVADKTRHKPLASVGIYIRIEDAYDNAATRLGLRLMRPSVRR